MCKMILEPLLTPESKEGHVVVSMGSTSLR